MNELKIIMAYYVNIVSIAAVLIWNISVASHSDFYNFIINEYILFIYIYNSIF